MSQVPRNNTPSGGSQELPSSVNLMRFTASRSKEIRAMKCSLSKHSGTKLIFQKLPKHMRRRVMSHNAKRLPRRLREIHLNQLKKSGMPPKQKRPSRKFRRRPRNLMEDYARRQRKHTWLETHIWHAKRFHMVERWGHKLPDRPCDKAFRACYRASARHCLLQDISYHNCVELSGAGDILIENLKKLCDPSVGLSFGAKAYLKGNREGQTIIYKHNTLPKKAIGPVYFNWKPIIDEEIQGRTIWIWIHAAYYLEVLNSIIDCFNLINNMCSANIYSDIGNNVKLTEQKYSLNRFRLTGPLSHSVLQKACKPVDVNASDLHPDWFQNYIKDDHLRKIITDQNCYWKNLENLSSPAALPPWVTLSLIVSDPRFNFPKKRSKAVPVCDQVKIDALNDVPDNVSVGSIWDSEIREKVKESKISNAKIAELRSRLLVPGSDLETPGVPVPIVLIQQPGNRENISGYSCGWDVIVPAGWAQATWLALIMWGARAGGLREFDHMRFEGGRTHLLAPDTIAGAEEERRITEQYKQRYFSLPPNKRINYTKFSIVCPFDLNWKVIIGDWKSRPQSDDFCVLRDRTLLQNMREFLLGRNRSISFKLDTTLNCLVAVRLILTGKGVARRFAVICLPKPEDLRPNKAPTEMPTEDENQAIRKETRDAHKMLLKRLRRRRVRAKENGKVIPVDTEMLEQYKNKMRNLWLPERSENIRNSCSRQIMGFVTEGDFTFTIGHNTAVGYVATGALHVLLSSPCKNKVLVRNTNSRQYRVATLDIICDVI